MENHRKYFDTIGKTKDFSITRYEQWYDRIGRDLHSHEGGGLLLRHYQGSLHNALETIYPEYQWNSWQFGCVGRKYWQDIENHRVYFDTVGKDHFSITHYEQWYDRIAEDIHVYGGQGLLRNWYEGSLRNALEFVYPEYQWRNWQFGRVGTRYWQNVVNQRYYFDQELLATSDNQDNTSHSALRDSIQDSYSSSNSNSNHRNNDSSHTWWTSLAQDIKQSYKYRAVMQLYYSTSSQLVTTLYPEFPFDESAIIAECDLSKGELDLWRHLQSLNIITDNYNVMNDRHPIIMYSPSRGVVQLSQ